MQGGSYALLLQKPEETVRCYMVGQNTNRRSNCIKHLKHLPETGTVLLHVSVVNVFMVKEVFLAQKHTEKHKASKWNGFI